MGQLNQLKDGLVLRFFCVFLLTLPTLSLAHRGGLDSTGGHTDRSTGQYHCHSVSCSTAQIKTEEATREAVLSNRPISFLYRREDWRHWSDFDSDCMNTRHEILKDQAKHSIKLSPDGCYVSMGVWVDPFSGKTYTRASELDVDHVVPLHWANDHGGNAWSKRRKELFANDPINLLAVDDSLNQQKGAKGPTEWLPPNHSFRCEYLSMWTRVLNKYEDLKMSAPELRIFQKQLQACSHAEPQ